MYGIIYWEVVVLSSEPQFFPGIRLFGERVKLYWVALVGKGTGFPSEVSRHLGASVRS